MEALKYNSDSTDLYFNNAIIYWEKKDVVSAQLNFAKSLELDPANKKAHRSIAKLFLDSGNLKSAKYHYLRCVELEPNNCNNHLNLGVCYLQIGCVEKAIASLSRALIINPESVEAHFNLGNTLQSKENYLGAIDSYNKALELAPNHAESHYNKGIAQYAIEKPEDAIQSYKLALALNSEYLPALNNLANVYSHLSRFESANKLYKKCIELDPLFVNAWINSGNMHKELSGLDDAINHYEKALEIDKNNVEAKFNLGTALLLKGEFKRGLNLYEFRLLKQKPTTRQSREEYTWDGISSLSKRRVYVYAEQGLGDTIHFCRYLIQLKKLGAEVTFVCPLRLHRLISTLDYQINLVDKYPAEISPDYEMPLLSLPFLLQHFVKGIPSYPKYLSVPMDRRSIWKHFMREGKFKIGICWQGAKGKIDKGRSVQLSYFEKISEIDNTQLVSLHRGEGEAQLNNLNFEVTQLGKEFDSGDHAFVDTASVMEMCDIVITTDTSVAHLAGALGVKTFLLLKKVPEWRWGLVSRETQWYPTIKLYRQKRAGDWDSVFAEVKSDIATESARAS